MRSKAREASAEEVGRNAKQQAREDAEAAKKVVLPNAGSVLDWRKDRLSVLYIEPDGTMVPMRPEDRPAQRETSEDRPATHREAKVGVVFWQKDVMNVSPKRREVRRKRYVATMGDVEEFREDLWAVVAQMERLWEVGRLIFGRGDLAARPWVKEQQARLEKSDIDGVLDELREERTTTPLNPGDKAALQDYATYLDAGLMIGSGIVESSNRRVIGLRLKQAGMHWSKAGADAVMHVRALYLSDGDGWGRLWPRDGACA